MKVPQDLAGARAGAHNSGMGDNSGHLVSGADVTVQVHWNRVTGRVWVTSDSTDPELVLGVLLRAQYQVLTTPPHAVKLEP